MRYVVTKVEGDGSLRLVSCQKKQLIESHNKLWLQVSREGNQNLMRCVVPESHESPEAAQASRVAYLRDQVATFERRRQAAQERLRKAIAEGDSKVWDRSW